MSFLSVSATSNSLVNTSAPFSLINKSQSDAFEFKTFISSARFSSDMSTQVCISGILAECALVSAALAAYLALLSCTLVHLDIRLRLNAICFSFSKLCPLFSERSFLFFCSVNIKLFKVDNNITTKCI